MSDKDKKVETEEEVKDDLSQISSPKTITNFLAATFVLVIALSFGGYLLYKNFVKGNSEDNQALSEIGTKVDKSALTFKEAIELDKKPTVEEVKEEKVEDIESNPFVVNNTSNDFKVYKSDSSAIIPLNSDSSNSLGEINSDGTRTIVSPTGDILRIDKNGNIIEKEPGNEIAYNEHDNNIMGQVFSPQIAKKSKYNPNLLLSKGTYIGCSLNTRVVSTIAGGISCTISQNVYSSNGNVLLIERGSIVTGYFNSGQLKNGMNRIFVTWQEIRTPKNIIIPVYSGASDELGGSGMVGEVDNHYLERFGASILLSVIDDAFNVLLNGGTGTRGNKNTDYTESTGETTKEMASIALEKFINIEPTLYKNQGDLVGIYVNKDIDFSKVYSLKRIIK